MKLAKPLMSVVGHGYIHGLIRGYKLHGLAPDVGVLKLLENLETYLSLLRTCCYGP